MFTPGVSQLSPGGKVEYASLVAEAKQYLSMRGKTPGSELEAVSKHEQLRENFDNRVLDDISCENSLFLVKFFVERKNFEHARKYLCLADALVRNMGQKEIEYQKGFIFPKLEYFLGLLKSSSDKLQERKKVMILQRKDENLDKFSFTTNCRNSIAQFENCYRTLPAKDWHAVKEIFSDAKKYVDSAMKILSFEEDKLKRVEVHQILSKMYKHLSMFQQEKIASNDALDRVSKIHWRRIQCLEACLMYLEKEDGVQIQEITFELADIYLQLLEMKQKKFERTAGNLDPKLLQKMVFNYTYNLIFIAILRLTTASLASNNVKHFCPVFLVTKMAPMQMTWSNLSYLQGLEEQNSTTKFLPL